MACGIGIPDRAEGEPEIKAGPGTRSYEDIERLQWQFRESVRGMLDVEVGPPLDEEIKEVA